MTHHAAIAAQLVDVKNVNLHKCVRLTLDVPAEQAVQVIEAFGWPTQATPVPVAIARLEQKAASAPVSQIADHQNERPNPRPNPNGRLIRQVGMLCADPLFQRFLVDKGFTRDVGEEPAAAYVRKLCEVASRADLEFGTRGATRWDMLHSAFLVWKTAA